jgi:hypothetical protein
MSTDPVRSDVDHAVWQATPRTPDCPDFCLEPLMGDGVFRHFRPIFRGTLIANVVMDAERGNRLIAQGLADLVAFGPALHCQSRPWSRARRRRDLRS